MIRARWRALGCKRRSASERGRALEKSLGEQLVLMREVHHRVKNNLQAIIHLMEMERDRIGDPEARSLLDGLRERARTMALVYEQVYQSPSLARVDMDPTCRRLASGCTTSSPRAGRSTSRSKLPA